MDKKPFRFSSLYTVLFSGNGAGGVFYKFGIDYFGAAQRAFFFVLCQLDAAFYAVHSVASLLFFACIVSLVAFNFWRVCLFRA